MALGTLGTSGTGSLSYFLVGTNDVIAADLATLNVSLFGDPPGFGAWPQVNTSGLVTGIGTNRPLLNAPYLKGGLLVIPNRGQIQCKPGDFVCFDPTTGWPILISGDAAANGPYVHS